ncbi:Isopentenyl-diphosphate Delta-isomerase 1 [Smittium culicis]|uniref:isopentenyl-diphosphate Delta-isomerase n=1 Tax=Smittium culicis TaxID=133412 RepID=A0A1R1YCD4_9FUNG|nr:Isopentenyl-diphosphate Delta-isomerase 1 [Smittium culicis]OMJ24326.1 Isopentenyl-diphosphate Delta-isomerase 1 [Smittium culicis]
MTHDTERNNSKYDQDQIEMMKERCILVDENDNCIGSADKWDCHRITEQSEGKLHRAFSVFLFDEQGRLLLQQRSAEKITFPNHYTNTCCSHPLNFKEELETKDQLGVRNAAKRKLNHELGIPLDQINIDQFKYLTRIHYKSASDDKWVEHEIDYILFLKAKVDLNINPNEVRSYKYVSENDLKQLFKDSETASLSEPILITPWFKIIYNNFLSSWWSNLDKIESLKADDKIHKMI